MKSLVISTLILSVVSVSPYALASSDAPSAAVSSRDQIATLSDGEIKKIDKALGKLIIKHGPLENLGMPAMTMLFRVANPALLEQVKPGDRIKFLAQKVDGALTVTTLEIVAP